jgi:hypothetical protein
LHGERLIEWSNSCLRNAGGSWRCSEMWGLESICCTENLGPNFLVEYSNIYQHVLLNSKITAGSQEGQISWIERANRDLFYTVTSASLAV